MAFSHPKLEVKKLIYPGPFALEAIERKPSVRSFPLSELPDLKVCCWCNTSPIQKPRRRYCSQDCVDSAVLFCHPQQPAAKMYVLLQLQDCTCVGCGECYDDEIRTMIDAEVMRRESWKEEYPDQEWFKGGGDEQVSLHTLGYGTGDRWEVDHIIPIFRGGRGVSIENIQVLCVNCHRKKTARERKA